LLEVYSTYHLARLKGDPACADLQSLYAQAHDSLKATIEEHRAARLATMTAMASRDGQETVLDDAVRDFSLAMLGKVHNIRTSPLFVTYFPGGTTEITTASLDAKLTRVGSILVKLGSETDADIKALEASLQAAQDGLRSAVQIYHDALDHQQHCMSVARAEVLRWLDAYRRSHKDLDRKFYQDPRRVESYFKKPRNGKRDAGSGEDAMAAEAPAVAMVAMPAGNAVSIAG
jgi:hypothetical protein